MKHEEEEGRCFFDRDKETVADVFVQKNLGKNRLLPRKRGEVFVVVVVRRWRGEEGLGLEKIGETFLPSASRLPCASLR